MFETPETKGESSGLGMWVGILVAVAVIIGAVVFFMSKKSAGSSAASTTDSAAAPTQSNADAVKDLRIVSKKLDKDYTGTTAMWSVEIRNTSQAYTYSNIQYETTYVGSDGGDWETTKARFRRCRSIPVNRRPRSSGTRCTQMERHSTTSRSSVPQGRNSERRVSGKSHPSADGDTLGPPRIGHQKSPSHHCCAVGAA